MAVRKTARSKGRKTSSKPPVKALRWHATPLKGSFMALSILGFFITAYLIYPQSQDYGIAFFVVFTAMFIASLISMTKAPVME